MFGLILSILIFTNIINYMYNSLYLNIYIIIYIYLLIISVSCEIIETRENKMLRILLVNHINTRSVIANRFDINMLSIILKKNNIDEISFYFTKEIENKVEKFKVGYTYYTIDSLKDLKNKLNYRFYSELRIIVYIYFSRIDDYIYFKYNN